MVEKLARSIAYLGFFLMPAFSLLRVYKNLSVSDVLVGGAFLFLVACRPGKALFAILRNPLNLLVALFLVAFLVTFAASGSGGGQAVESLFSLAQLLFCIYAMTTVLFLCEIDTALACVATSTVILSVGATLFMAGVLDIGAFILPWGRLSIEGVEPNVAARVFFVGGVIACFHWRRELAWMYSGTTVFCWLATYSRSGLLALATLVAALVRKRPLFSLLTTGAALCLLLFLPRGSSEALAIYTERVAEAVRLSDYNTTSRLDMARRGIEMMVQSPLVGVGMNVHPEEVGAVHNAFIGTGVEIGLLGMISLLLMYGVVWQIAWRLERSVGMLSVLVVGTVLFDLFMSVSQNRIFWFPFSLVLALYLQRLSSSGHRPASVPALTSRVT